MYKKGNKNKKGQAALEFLMTYGWAILVVLVVIGALAYFGVLDPNSLIPDKCSLEVGFGCLDHKVSENQVDLYLENGFGRTIEITNITVYSTKTNTEWCSLNNLTSGESQTDYLIKLKNGQGQLISLENSSATNCNFNDIGRKLKLGVNISYTNVDTEVKHTATGEILSKIES